MRAWSAVLWVLVACAALAGCAASPAFTDGRFPPGRSDRYLIVAVANPVPNLVRPAGGTPRIYGAPARYRVAASARSDLDELARAHHLKARAEWPIAELGVHCVVFEIADGREPNAVISALRADPRVDLVQPMNTFVTRGTQYDDPYLQLQRGFMSMDVGPAHGWSTGRGVRVAVIDTGVDRMHPDLAGRIAVDEDLVRGDFRGFDEDRHGTAVAGVIAARANNGLGIVGVAPEAEILALKGCWHLESSKSTQAICNSFTLARAIVAALRHGVQIINMSLTGPRDALLERLLRGAIADGVIVVSAAAAQDDMGFPASMPDVIAVHMDSTGGADLIHAPGHDILTLRPGAHYDFESGSSIAAAQVSGVVALLLQSDPRLTTPRVRELLEASVAGGSGGARIINACTALKALGHDGRCPSEARLSFRSIH